MILPAFLLMSQEPSLSSKLAYIESAFEEQRIKDHVPGAALVIVKDGKVILMKGFGVRNLESGEPVDADTLFATQSITKTFTATAFMKAVEEGRMSVGDRPGKFLPWLTFKDAELQSKVTFRDLLSHRSGLANANYVWMPGVLSRREAIKIAAQAAPTAKIGERFQYNNLMFSAVGDAVGAAYKTTWERVVEAKLFQPLGMTRTHSSVPRMLRDKNHAEAHDPNPYNGQIDRIPSPAVDGIAPASAAFSTARDMAKWLKVALNDGAYEKGRILSKRRWDEMMTLQFRLGPPGGWTLGWSRRDWRGRKLFFHNGGGYGWTASMAFMPDEKIGFVFLSNLTAAPLRETAAELIWTTLVEDGKPRDPGPAPAQAAVTAPQPAPADLYNRILKARPNLQSVWIQARVDYPQQGLTGRATITWARPDRVTRVMTLETGKRLLGDFRISLDGIRGEARWSFLRDGPVSDAGRTDTLALNDLPPFALLMPKAEDAETRGGDAFLLAQAPGVSSCLAPDSLRVTKRETASGYRQELSDWREVNGFMMPFSITEFWPGLGDVVLTVERVDLTPGPNPRLGIALSRDGRDLGALPAAQLTYPALQKPLFRRAPGQ